MHKFQIEIEIHNSSHKAFLDWIHVSDSISSAIRTRNKEFPFYKKNLNSNARNQIRSFLRNYLLNLWSDSAIINKDDMLQAIKELQIQGKAKFSSHLHDGEFRLGVSQKMICLFAKYRWVSGQIKNPPPLVPYDGVVKSALNNPRLIDWTNLKEWCDYKAIVEAIEIVAEQNDEYPAEWELRIWNESVLKDLKL